MRRTGAVSFLLIAALALTGFAHAQEALHKQVYACASMADAGQRHACFDSLVPDLKKAGNALAANSMGAPKPTPAASPLTEPVVASGQSKAPKPDPGPDKVKLLITSMAPGADGKLRFTMENGQVWRQLDTIRLRNLGPGPWTAEVRKALLGSFLLSIGKSPAIRVERVN